MTNAGVCECEASVSSYPEFISGHVLPQSLKTHIRMYAHTPYKMTVEPVLDECTSANIVSKWKLNTLELGVMYKHFIKVLVMHKTSQLRKCF